MCPSPAKDKRANSAAKYPGKLGHRRPPAKEQDLQAGLSAVLGRTPSAIETQLAAVMDPITNYGYYDEGISLVAKHLGVRAQFSGMWATAGAFWQELALKLLQTHVPYFMPAARRGARPTLRALFPVLELIISGIKKGDALSEIRPLNAQTAKLLGATKPALPPSPPLRWTANKAYENIAKLAGNDVDTVRREFTRWRNQKRGGKSAE
jgi:hypothetical protein